jgi:DNA-binding MarR family transcriptional regulator
VKSGVNGGRAWPGAASPSLRVLPCACANLRRAARAVSQLYDEELRGAGLSIAQFTLLQVLVLAGEISQVSLGRLLALDSTTLTRTLRPLETKGWIRRRTGKDRREKRIVLTRAGRSRFQRAVPAWNRAQQRARARVGRRRWQALLKELSRIAGISGPV